MGVGLVEEVVADGGGAGGGVGLVEEMWLVEGWGWCRRVWLIGVGLVEGWGWWRRCGWWRGGAGGGGCG